ncbi:DeoR/GlpR family DNA-binding transcription regulator [Bosea sp. (in: a-proteobacteria)]|jgi:DeoR family glycerol-3-phosphate regulon repressor|uniref:DeoR/GlpR family DNA-binding transcription regulator n=1 Tax=Bosea sp. (in: a-proteobacteria) TaxID=1871050 RepID=UPI002DDD25D8|nr:DeoR/GlpR family DNA-binding transcription regulator [Bosea sp. (in: a-proteobacteria)]HEV2510047.1 DeoR/GlpR family DNA-binding transcription regulator [Bosea sp. (in: a-proteobacteria)]
MEPLSKRHADILDILGKRGYVAIEEIVSAFNVTPQTVRRDLQDLADRGLLRRHHGGASANLSTANTDYGLRVVETAGEKVAMAQAAAELVTPGTSLFITPGTTMDALAKAIAERRPRGLRVVTNSTAAAAILDKCPEISILITGGHWLGPNRACGGMHAAAFIENYRCDLHMTSIGGIDAAGNLLEYRDDEAVVGRTMLRNARRSVLLADHTKFSRVAMSRLAHLSEISTLVTDRQPSAATERMIRDARCELIVAG